MAVAVEHPLDKYVRTEKLPTLWCPGCTIGIVMTSLLRAIDQRIREGLLRRDQITFVGGIGCSARIAMYVRFDSVRTAHGRTIPLATAIKILRPDHKVIVVGGDGDICAIGGNHLLHALRRNMDLMIIIVNNMIYGMTGGQVSPTTPLKLYTTTTPYGNPEKPLNIIRLACSLGANFVARGSATHPHILQQIFYKALGKRGLALIEVLSSCPEIFGRHIGITDPVKSFMTLREKIKVKSNPSLDESEYDWERGFVIGVYLDKDDPGYIDNLSLLYKSLRGF